MWGITCLRIRLKSSSLISGMSINLLNFWSLQLQSITILLTCDNFKAPVKKESGHESIIIIKAKIMQKKALIGLRS